MTPRIPSSARPGSLRRCGATLAIVVVLMITTTACAPVSPTVASELDAIYAQSQGLQPQRQEAQQRRDVVILEWATELGVSEEFSQDELNLAFETAAADGAHGPRSLSLWDFYQDYIEQQSQLIGDEIRDDLSIEDVRAYYEQSAERFARQDAVTVEVTEWEGERAVSTYIVDVDETNVRGLQERDDQLIAAASDLAEGEEASVDRGDGRFAQVRCITRTDAGLVPFDDVVQAAASQLTNELFEDGLEEREAGTSDPS